MRLAVARDAGLDENTIADVIAANTDEFPAQHRAALALADSVMAQPSSLTEAEVDALRHYFTDEQLIELTLDIMKWNAQKVSVALGTDVWLQEGELSDLVFDEQGNWVR